MEFEKVFPELAYFGRYQKLIFFFVLLPCQISFYMHLYSQIFFTYQPNHWCSNISLFSSLIKSHSSTDKLNSNDSLISISQSELFNNKNLNVSSMSVNNTATLSPQSFFVRETFRRFFYTPHRGFIDPKYLGGVRNLLDYTSGYDRCNMFNATFNEIDTFHRRVLPLFEHFRANDTLQNYFSDNNHSQNSNFQLSVPPIVQCNSWKFNRTALFADETIVTKWFLVCNREWMQVLPLCALLAGYCCVQLFYNSLVQRIGQRTMFFASLLLQCSSVAGCAFVTEFSIFCLLRFVTGITMHAIIQVPIDLIIELSGVRCMSHIVFFNESMRLIGATILAIIANNILDYRQLSLALSIPFAVLLFFYCSFPESLHHLFVNGQIDRLEKLIISIAHTNFRFRDPEFDASIRRRIYVELELYRELVLALLLPEASIPLRENIEQSDRRVSNSSTLVENFVKSLQESSTTGIDVDSEACSQEIVLESKDDEIETIEPNSSLPSQNDKNDNSANIANITSSPTSETPPIHSVTISSSLETNPIEEQSSKQNLFHSNSISLLKIVQLPNLRMKFFILAILSAIHCSIYFSLPFFVADFAENRTIHEPQILFRLFTFNILLSFIGIWLAYGCLHCNFGRKLTFFFSNILATAFLFWAGITMTFQNFDDANHCRTLAIIAYCVAKLFQTVCFSVLNVWIFELLPPIAACSSAIRACSLISSLSLNCLPLMLHFWTYDCRVCMPTKPYLTIPCHYLIATFSLFLSCLICLFLPETGSVSRLPNSLHEAELFSQWNSSSSASSSSSSASSMSTSSGLASLTGAGPVGGTGANSSSSDSSKTNTKCHSLKGLFNFQPPNIRHGILKKSNIQSRESTILRRKRQLDTILEQKFAAITKDCANKTAFNSVCNQFLSTPGFISVSNPFGYCNALTNHQLTSGLTICKPSKDRNFNVSLDGFHQSSSQAGMKTHPGNGFGNAGFLFGALTDGVATGLPLLNYFNPNSAIQNETDPLPLNSKIENFYHQSIENQCNSLELSAQKLTQFPSTSTSNLDEVNLNHWFEEIQPTSNPNVHLVDVELNSDFHIPHLDDDVGLFDNTSHNLTQALAFDMEIANPIILDI